MIFQEGSDDMFSKPLQEVKEYTKPILFATKLYDEEKIIKGSATLFFVNELGYAITCKHVAIELINFQKIKEQFEHKKNNNTLKKGDPISRSFSFPNTYKSFGKINFTLHSLYDLAIIKFEDVKEKLYDNHAFFPRDNAKVDQGTSVCKIGFPYAEFDNVKFFEENQNIVFDNSKLLEFQHFPLDGIITRHLFDQNKKKFGFETSSPGLRGQSGGPIINKDGLVVGIQSMTRHIHLGFDIENFQIKKNNTIKTVSDYQFINLGIGIDYKIIKKFLHENNVKYYEK